MSELEDAITQLSNKQYDQFKSSVSDMLMDRLKGRIDNEKYAVGQSIFNDQDEQEAQAELDQDYQPEVEESEQQEETSDEEV